MKSFRLQSEEPVTPPDRDVTDYSPTEIAVYQAQFLPIVRRYRVRTRMFHGGLFVFALCIALGMILREPYDLYAFGAAFFPFAVAAISALPVLPDCPACEINLGAGLGRYCPECGCSSMRPGSWFRWSQCSSCGASRKGANGYNSEIQFCSHCGLPLTQRGP